MLPRGTPARAISDVGFGTRPGLIGCATSPPVQHRHLTAGAVLPVPRARKPSTITPRLLEEPSAAPHCLLTLAAEAIAEQSCAPMPETTQTLSPSQRPSPRASIDSASKSRLETVVSSPGLYEQLCRTTFRNSVQEEAGTLSRDQACTLAKALCSRLGLPAFAENLFRCVFLAVDEDADGLVSESDFVRLYEVYLSLAWGYSKMCTDKHLQSVSSASTATLDMSSPISDVPRSDAMESRSTLGSIERIRESEGQLVTTNVPTEAQMSRWPAPIDWSTVMNPA